MPEIRKAFLRSGVPVLTAGFVLLGIIIAATFWFLTLEQHNRQAIQQALEVETHLYRALISLEDAETGQRGYLLTGDAAYLAPYDRATTEFDQELEALGTAAADNPRQTEALNDLRLIAKEKLAELRATIEQYRAGNNRKALSIVHEGTGKALMDRARARHENRHARPEKCFAYLGHRQLADAIAWDRKECAHWRARR
jgi:CHASE3 domain sensor protein